MKLEKGRTEIIINLSFAAAVTLMLIVDDTGICALTLFCCIIHEAGHIICLGIMGEKPARVIFSFYGIRLERMTAEFHGRRKEILIYLSGPLANFILCLLLFFVQNRKFILPAQVSLFVGLFNLIPCRPLDGGNILFSLLCGQVDESTANSVCSTVSVFILVPMLVSGIVFAVRAGNFTLLGTAAYLLSAFFENKKSRDF